MFKPESHQSPSAPDNLPVPESQPASGELSPEEFKERLIVEAQARLGESQDLLERRAYQLVLEKYLGKQTTAEDATSSVAESTPPAESRPPENPSAPRPTPVPGGPSPQRIDPNKPFTFATTTVEPPAATKQPEAALSASPSPQPAEATPAPTTPTPQLQPETPDSEAADDPFERNDPWLSRPKNPFVPPEPILNALPADEAEVGEAEVDIIAEPGRVSAPQVERYFDERWMRSKEIVADLQTPNIQDIHAGVEKDLNEDVPLSDEERTLIRAIVGSIGDEQSREQAGRYIERLWNYQGYRGELNYEEHGRVEKISDDSLTRTAIFGRWKTLLPRIPIVGMWLGRDRQRREVRQIRDQVADLLRQAAEKGEYGDSGVGVLLPDTQRVLLASVADRIDIVNKAEAGKEQGWWRSLLKIPYEEAQADAVEKARERRREAEAWERIPEVLPVTKAEELADNASRLQKRVEKQQQAVADIEDPNDLLKTSQKLFELNKKRRIEGEKGPVELVEEPPALIEHLRESAKLLHDLVEIEQKKQITKQSEILQTVEQHFTTSPQDIAAADARGKTPVSLDRLARLWKSHQLLQQLLPRIKRVAPDRPAPPTNPGRSRRRRP